MYKSLFLIAIVGFINANVSNEFNGSTKDGKDQYSIPTSEFKYKVVEHKMKINYQKAFKIIKLVVQRLAGDKIQNTYTYYIKQIFKQGVNINNSEPIEIKKFVEMEKNGIKEIVPLPEVCFVPEFKKVKKNTCEGYYKASVEATEGTSELIANQALEKPGLEVLVKNLKKENFEKLTKFNCNIDVSGKTVIDLNGYLKRNGITLDFVRDPQALTTYLKNNKREGNEKKYDTAVCASLILVMNKVNSTGNCLVQHIFKRYSLRILCSVKAINSSDSAENALMKAFKNAGIDTDKYLNEIKGVSQHFDKKMKDHNSKLGTEKAVSINQK